MKFKTLSFAVLTSLSLIGCGGSDNNSDNSTNTNTGNNNNSNPNGSTGSGTQPNNQITQWSNFRTDYNYTNNVNISLDLSSAQFNIVNGKLYAVLDDYDDQEIYLTTSGEYLAMGPIDSKYGALLGDISVKNNQFTIYPYSKIGSTGLVFTQENQTIVLDGKPVLVAVDPYLNWDVNYPQFSYHKFDPAFLNTLKSYQKLSFPKGSVCLQETKYTNNQAYLTLFKSSNDNKQMFEDYAASYLNNVNHHYAKLTQFFNSTAYLYSYDQTTENAHDGVANYQGNYYATYLENKGAEYDLAAYIQDAKDQATDPTLSADEKAAHQALANDLSQSCDLYNDVAIQFLKQNIK